LAYNESPHDQAGPGAMAVGVLESNPETKVALRLNDDGRLMVEVSGLAIDADIIDLDMDALTGAPPDNASLYDLWELMQIISGGTDLWNLENQLDAIRGTAELIDMDVLGVMDSLMAGSDLCDRVEAVHMAVEYLSGGVDLSVVDGDILRAADSLWVISSGDQVGLGDVWMAVDALGGGADLSLVDGDILRCADSLWAMTEGDAVSLGDVWLAVEALGGGRTSAWSTVTSSAAPTRSGR